MKKISILLLLVFSTLLLTSCGSERCPCNTFGYKKELNKPQHHFAAAEICKSAY
ncbi:MAG: hypothetical protein NTX03_10355 [Bacteroidetes bacterium]|nr:hypothetical protein [Bacteroidota bacterium]